MARPSQLDQQRRTLLPILAAAFRDLGYRRATTAELARRCGVRENILYRHWQDKRTMFVAALDQVLEVATSTWTGVQDEGPLESAAARLLAFESEHLGEFGNYKIIFSALAEADDPEIGAALQRMYSSLHKHILALVQAAPQESKDLPPATSRAWGILGLGTMATIGAEIGLLSPRQRKALLTQVGQALLGEASE